MSTVIDLPVSPLRSTVAEGSLIDAPVVATLMDGKTISGRLLGLDGPQKLVTLQCKGLSRATIKFSRLRALNFIARHPINRARHPLQQHTVEMFMPKASQEFRITFIDRKLLAGRTRGSFVDDIGIHLFQLVDNAHISRLFIPAEVVRKYYIGHRKPTEVHQKHADPLGKRDPLQGDAKPIPQRRKTDKRGRRTLSASAEQLEHALEQQGAPAVSLTAAKRIGEMLVEEGIITPEQLDAALKTQERDPTAKLGEILVRMGTVSAEEIYATLAHKFGMPFVLLRKFFVDIECLRLIPAEVARKYALVPLLIHKDRLVIAMDDPANAEALTLLRFITQYKVEPTIATRDDINWAIKKYYGGSDARPPSAAPAPTPQDNSRPEASTAQPADGNQPGMEKAVASFVSNTILDAMERNASDIHIVPEWNYADLLFRIEGALIPIRRFSRVILPAVMTRLKAMIGLNASVPGAPQQGRANMVSDDTVIELRIAMEQREKGESAVIHILNTINTLKPVADLELGANNLQAFTEMLRKSYSMIIVSGPKGSGKSRTIYAALRTIQDMKRRIVTAEAPVTYHIDGIEQFQADDKDDGLVRAMERARAIDSDVMMIGEIGDRMTLELAMEVALGGRLVLSKIHADSAVAAVARMTNLGVPRRPLTSTLAGVLAQHLLRLNCKFCVNEEVVDPVMRKELGIGKDEVFYCGSGCEQCGNTGHSGEQTVFELLSVTPEMRTIIATGAPVQAVYERAISDGMIPVAETAIGLARMRKISLAEAHRLFLKTRIG